MDFAAGTAQDGTIRKAADSASVTKRHGMPSKFPLPNHRNQELTRLSPGSKPSS